MLTMYMSKKPSTDKCPDLCVTEKWLTEKWGWALGHAASTTPCLLRLVIDSHSIEYPKTTTFESSPMGN
jgi:hypothetical protein